MHVLRSLKMCLKMSLGLLKYGLKCFKMSLMPFASCLGQAAVCLCQFSCLFCCANVCRNVCVSCCVPLCKFGCEISCKCSCPFPSPFPLYPPRSALPLPARSTRCVAWCSWGCFAFNDICVLDCKSNSYDQHDYLALDFRN